MKSLLLIETIVLVGCCATATMAQCVTESEAFASVDGGCKDLSTGLVFVQGNDSEWGNVSERDPENSTYYCRVENQNEVGGFTDWRLPTVGEFEEALANGLESHLDYGVFDSSDYFYTRCQTKIKGANWRYSIRHSDGDVMSELSASHPTVCVRGGAADLQADCPRKDGGGKGKDKNALLLPRSATGALLLSPLWMTALVCGLKRQKL